MELQKAGLVSPKETPLGFAGSRVDFHAITSTANWAHKSPKWEPLPHNMGGVLVFSFSNQQSKKRPMILLFLEVPSSFVPEILLSRKPPDARGERPRTQALDFWFSSPMRGRIQRIRPASSS